MISNIIETTPDTIKRIKYKIDTLNNEVPEVEVHQACELLVKQGKAHIKWGNIVSAGQDPVRTAINKNPLDIIKIIAPPGSIVNTLSKEEKYIITYPNNLIKSYRSSIGVEFCSKDETIKLYLMDLKLLKDTKYWHTYTIRFNIKKLKAARDYISEYFKDCIYKHLVEARKELEKHHKKIELLEKAFKGAVI